MAKTKGTLKLSKAARDQLREVFESFMVTSAEGEKPKLQEWIEKVARKNPGRAAELALGIAEYCAPKLARVENTGKDGGPMRVIVNQVSAKPQQAPAEGT